MKRLLPLLILALFAACSNDDNPIPDYKNKWLETSLRRDTITFPLGLPEGTSADLEKLLKLSSYLEPQDSRHFHAIYQFKAVPGDSLGLYNMYWSNYRFDHFYFKKISDKEFQIDNFYGRAELPKRLTFRRMQ